LQRKADRAERIASGNNPRESRVQRVQDAVGRAQNYGYSRAASTGKAAAGTVSTANEIRNKVNRIEE